MEAPCSDYEDLILAYFDQSLSTAEKQRVENHIRGCRACGTFWSSQRSLDAMLSSTFARPNLPPSFKENLLRQVQAEAAFGRSVLETTSDGELDFLLVRLKETLRQRAAFALLDAFGYLAIALVLVLVCLELGTRVPVPAATLPKAVSLYVAWGSAALVLSLGIWFGLKREFRLAGFWRQALRVVG
jgi:anti-sigma factor RsiW